MRANAVLLLSLLPISLPVVALPQWQPTNAGIEKSTLPAHLQGLASLPPGSVTAMRSPDEKSAATWQLTLPDGTRHRLADPQEIVHPNGDVTVSGSVVGAGGLYAVVMTVGADASFGRWQTPQGEYRFESWGDRGWLLDLDHAELAVVGHEDDAVATSRRTAPPAPVAKSSQEKGGIAIATIDVLFVYTAGFAQRYPGTASATRLNHVVAVANQAFANSGAAVALRAVGMDRVGYTDNNDNAFALENLQAAGEGDTVPGLETIAARRAATGADLVSLWRPHDIELRGNCGIAFLFTGNASEGYNVNSDSFDSWSLCDDQLLAHEVGHNIGAEHQIGATSEDPGFGTAFIVPGKFHTVMGSFGSGHPDRNRSVLGFSDPNRFCGGIACGIDNVADNARRIRDNMHAVAGFKASVVAGTGVAPPPTDPDSDGDALADSEDAFPFDPDAQADADGDGIADNRDAFPGNGAESGDIDDDGIGDNADQDRDGDGTPNAQDALPDDPAGASDSDDDRIADTADAFPGNRNEWLDTDDDGIGNNADPDADGDGVPDLETGSDLAAFDLLVVSGEHIIRLDGGSGLYGGIEVRETHVPQAFGPRAALAWDASRKRISALVAGDVRRYERAANTRESILIESHRLGPQPGLASGLAAGFAVDADGTLYVGDSSTLTLRRYDAVSGEERPGGVFGSAPFFDSPPRALAIGPGRRLWTIDRSGRMAEIDLDSGNVLRTLIPRVAGAATTNPSALAVAPGGSALFVAEVARDRVVRIDPAQPTQATVFVAAGSGGLDAPGGLAFGADGRLYVSSGGSDAVLRYDGSTGAFVDRFSVTPPGALPTPRALAFAPKVRDRYPLDAARRFRPIAGGWSNAARPGHGIDLQTLGADLVLTWYTYDSDGAPIWYLAVGPLAGAEFDVPLLRTQWDGSQATTAEVGRARLTFSSEHAVQFDYTIDGFSGSEAMVPVAAGSSSETQFPTAAWFAPSQAGWGLTVARQGEIAYAVAFFYDNDGNPTWAIGGGAGDASPLTFSMTHPSGPCPQCDADAELPAPYTVGSLQFDVIDGTGATVDLDLQDDNVDWQYSDTPFVRASDSPTHPDGTAAH